MSKCSILVIGSGRMAKHLCHYLKIKGHSFKTWTRSDTQDLEHVSHSSDLVFLAVSDDAIANLAHRLPQNQKIHFSGSLYIPGTLGLHPLMTFGRDLYEENQYDQIPLVFDQPDLAPYWLKTLPNPIVHLNPEQKTLYHGLCHLAGNYPKFLWIEIAKIFKSQLNLPPEILKPYLSEILKQSLGKNPDSLTGPFARKDMETIQGHLSALDHSPLKTSYEGFLASFKETHP